MRSWEIRNDYPHSITNQTKAQRNMVICVNGGRAAVHTEPWNATVFTTQLYVEGGQAAEALARHRDQAGRTLGILGKN